MTERLARIEAQIEHLVRTVDELRATQKDIVAAMNRSEGAMSLGKWAVPSLGALLSLAAGYVGVHLPKPLP